MARLSGGCLVEATRRQQLSQERFLTFSFYHREGYFGHRKSTGKGRRDLLSVPFRSDMIAAMKQYWLVKSEPSVYSIDDLEREDKTYWDGIRNYQARNLMRDGMKQGDLVLFYHSNADPTGVVGVAAVEKEAYPDFTAWDPSSSYFDKKSTPDQPRWLMVDIAFREKFSRIVSLEEIKQEPALQDMVLVKNSRLSVQPVKPEEFRLICEMSRR